MSLAQFKQSSKGRQIAGILSATSTIRRMVEKSRQNRPAVEAIGREVEALVGSLDDEDRKMVGRWVKEVLAEQGWQPHRKSRVAPGHLFSRGTIYRVQGSSLQTGGAARMAAARALLADMPGRPQSAEELIAERRRAFGRGE